MEIIKQLPDKALQTDNLNISKSKIKTLLVYIVVVFCLIFNKVFIASILSAIAFFVYYYLLYIERPIVFLKYLWFYFCGVTAVVGCCLLEYSGIYLYELQTQAHYVGATPFIVLSYLTLFSVMNYNDKRLSDKLSNKVNKTININIKDIIHESKKTTDILVYIGTLIGFVLTMYAFIVVARNPSFMLGLDRFDYGEMFDYGPVYNMVRRVMRYFLIPCMVAAIYKKSKLGWAALAIYILYAFWTGNKFAAIFIMLWCFTILFSAKIVDKPKETRKILLTVALATFGLVVAAVVAVSFTRVDGFNNYLIPRITQQGQMFWKTFDASKEWHLTEIGDEIESLRVGDAEVKKNVGAKYGIYKVMYFVAPKTRIDNKLRAESRYTEAGFAASYYYMGICGCILFAIILGLMASTFINYFIHFILYSQYIRGFMLFRFFDHLTGTHLMFTFFTYFNKSAIISYIVLLLLSGIIFRFNISDNRS